MGKVKIKEDGKIYWGVHSTTVMFLIPKKRGRGFLKVPVGHHVNELSKLVSDLGYDCDGLDGYLSIWTGHTYARDKEFLKVVQAISEFYNNTETVEVGATAILNYLLIK